VLVASRLPSFGEMPAVHSTSLENCRFPHMTSLNEDDGWLRRSLKPSIVSRLRERHSLLEGEPPVESLHVHASVGCAANAAGAFIALCVLATKALTGAAEVFGGGCLLRLSGADADRCDAGPPWTTGQSGRRMFLSGRLAIDQSKRTNIRIPRRS
jgi:hypothetical protein